MPKQRIPLQIAAAKADQFVKLIEPDCDRIEVAGSIRRGKETIGDIEIVCTPRYVMSQQLDLFSSPEVQAENKLVPHLRELENIKVIKPRFNKSGHRIAWFPKKSTKEPKYLAFWWQGIPVDLFIVNRDQLAWWGYIFWLRTGPGEANQMAVTQEYKRGLCPNNVRMSDGIVYRDGVPWPVRTESEMFDVLQMVYLPPHKRSVQWYKGARWRWLRAKQIEQQKQLRTE